MKTVVRDNKTLFVLALVMVVNALGYGIIIPLLYPYSIHFGLTATGLSLLFVSFSIAQFIATPIIGRLSDTYGRKPLLLFSLFGTGLSLALFASAQTVTMLFIARIIDGISGGNISVAQAIVADKTSPSQRARAFGVLGAAFGFGFTFGPALGGFLGQYGLSTPFWFAALLAFAGVIRGIFLLEETNTHREIPSQKKKLFDVKAMSTALFQPIAGPIFLVSLIVSTALNSMIIGFQSYTVDTLQLTTSQVGLLFTIFGTISMVMQGFGIRFLQNKVPSKIRLVRLAITISTVLMCLVALSQGFVMFAITLLSFGAVNTIVSPLLTALLSERVNPEDQGGIMGLNQAYTSLAQIFGPLLAAGLVTHSAKLVFWATAILLLVGLIASKRITAHVPTKVDL